MSKNNSEIKPETTEAEAKAQKNAPTTIRWDGSKMKSSYSNVCNVSGSREEVTLLFGTNQNWYSGQRELTIELNDRIIMNPYAAKRLAILLNNTVQEYEKQFGEMILEIPVAKEN